MADEDEESLKKNIHELKELLEKVNGDDATDKRCDNLIQLIRLVSH